MIAFCYVCQATRPPTPSSANWGPLQPYFKPGPQTFFFLQRQHLPFSHIWASSALPAQVLIGAASTGCLQPSSPAAHSSPQNRRRSRHKLRHTLPQTHSEHTHIPSSLCGHPPAHTHTHTHFPSRHSVDTHQHTHTRA